MRAEALFLWLPAGNGCSCGRFWALRYVEPESQVRSAFSRVGTERRRPFVVKVDGMDAQSSGMMCVDAVDGTVMRTNLRVARPSGRGTVASIIVDFEKETRLGAWVPSKMSEQYKRRERRDHNHNRVVRQLPEVDTSVRIVPPEAQN